MEVKLLVTNEKANTREVRLGAETLIGRNRECNLRIVSGQVSRRHCLIKISDTRVVVRDLGSANGTEVDGTTIPPEIDVPVGPGSTLVVGPLKLVFDFTAPPPPEPNENDLQSTTQDITPVRADSEGEPIQDDTKDYGAGRQRSPTTPPPSAPPPCAEPGSSELDFTEGLPDSPVAVVGGSALPPSVGSSLVSAEETVYDNELADRVREAEARARAAEGRIETGTELLLDDSSATAPTDSPGVIHLPERGSVSPESPPAAEPDAPSAPKDAPMRRGWKLLDFLQRGGQKAETPPPGPDPTAPSPIIPPASAEPASEDDPALQDFLKRFEK